MGRSTRAGMGEGEESDTGVKEEDEMAAVRPSADNLRRTERRRREDALEIYHIPLYIPTTSHEISNRSLFFDLTIKMFKLILVHNSNGPTYISNLN